MHIYGIHKTLKIRNWLVHHPRFHLHFTPTSASWLKQVERWFATLTEKHIRRGIHRSTRQLEDGPFVPTSNSITPPKTLCLDKAC